jgi:hypothetical protein
VNERDSLLKQADELIRMAEEAERGGHRSILVKHGRPNRGFGLLMILTSVPFDTSPRDFQTSPRGRKGALG